MADPIIRRAIVAHACSPLRNVDAENIPPALAQQAQGARRIRDPSRTYIMSSRPHHPASLVMGGPMSFAGSGRQSVLALPQHERLDHRAAVGSRGIVSQTQPYGAATEFGLVPIRQHPLHRSAASSYLQQADRPNAAYHSRYLEHELNGGYHVADEQQQRRCFERAWGPQQPMRRSSTYGERKQMSFQSPSLSTESTKGCDAFIFPQTTWDDNLRRNISTSQNTDVSGIQDFQHLHVGGYNVLQLSAQIPGQKCFLQAPPQQRRGLGIFQPMRSASSLACSRDSLLTPIFDGENIAHYNSDPPHFDPLSHERQQELRAKQLFTSQNVPMGLVDPDFTVLEGTLCEDGLCETLNSVPTPRLDAFTTRSGTFDSQLPSLSSPSTGGFAQFARKRTHDQASPSSQSFATREHSQRSTMCGADNEFLPFETEQFSNVREMAEPGIPRCRQGFGFAQKPSIVDNSQPKLVPAFGLKARPKLRDDLRSDELFQLPFEPQPEQDKNKPLFTQQAAPRIQEQRVETQADDFDNFAESTDRNAPATGNLEGAFPSAPNSARPGGIAQFDKKQFNPQGVEIQTRDGHSTLLKIFDAQPNHSNLTTTTGDPVNDFFSPTAQQPIQNGGIAQFRKHASQDQGKLCNPYAKKNTQLAQKRVHDEAAINFEFPPAPQSTRAGGIPQFSQKRMEKSSPDVSGNASSAMPLPSASPTTRSSETEMQQECTGSITNPYRVTTRQESQTSFLDVSGGFGLPSEAQSDLPVHQKQASSTGDSKNLSDSNNALVQTSEASRKPDELSSHEKRIDILKPYATARSSATDPNLTVPPLPADNSRVIQQDKEVAEINDESRKKQNTAALANASTMRNGASPQRHSMNPQQPTQQTQNASQQLSFGEHSPDDESFSSDYPRDHAPTFETPAFLRFFNNGVEIDLTGRPVLQPGSPALTTQEVKTSNISSSSSPEDSDSLDGLELEGKSSLWGKTPGAMGTETPSTHPGTRRID